MNFFSIFPITNQNYTMKKTLSFIACSLFILHAIAQQTITSTISHDGLEREYILYVPANYTGTTAVPLLFNFHGYTSNAQEQLLYGDFRAIADTAGFIIVHPQGTLDGTGATHFNVGWGGSSVDDIGFTAALIDSLLLDYEIDQTRIYSTGMSNGGFMSFYLACELSERFAAVGSVTGSMVPATLSNCNATHQMPIIQIHGTADGTVPYNGSAGFTASIASVLSHWATYNNCETPATTTNIPNTNVVDGSTVQKTVYINGDNCSEVVHFKVTNGGHTWPGSAFNFSGTNYDINASIEVWNFLSRFDINGLINCSEIATIEEYQLDNSYTIYPNPSNSSIQLKGASQYPLEYEIFAIDGKLVQKGSIIYENQAIDVNQLDPNIYYLKINHQQIKLIKTNL